MHRKVIFILAALVATWISGNSRPLDNSIIAVSGENEPSTTVSNAPINVTVSNIIFDEAIVSWEAQGPESRWVVEWRAENQGVWYSAEVDTTSYLITGLYSRYTFLVRIAALNADGTQGEWSETTTFLSAYALPMAETFNGGEADMSDHWLTVDGALSDTNTVFSDNSGWEFLNTNYVKAMLFNGTYPCNSWVIFPEINFKETEVNYQMKITLYTISRSDGDEQIQIVASYDGGKTFNTAGVIHTISNADMPAQGQMPEYIIPLKEFTGKGKVRFGLLLTGTTGTPIELQLARVVIEESCYNDVWLRPTEIYGTSLSCTWEGATKDDDQQWMYFIRKQGETTKDYQYTSEYSMTFTGLEKSTTYEIGVTKACAADDIARPYILTVTTLSYDPCYPVDTIVATPHIYSLTLEWEGDAYSYNIDYRKTSDTDWLRSSVQGNTCTIEGLEPETTYEYRIQTCCSETRTSEWSAIGTATTLVAPECVTPTNLRVENITDTGATLAWDTDEGNLTWDINWRTATDTEWTEILALTTPTYTLGNLSADVAYVWRVKASCDEFSKSQWSEQGEFSTLVAGIDAVEAAGLTVYARGNTINISNPQGIAIDRVMIYLPDGKLSGDYLTNTTDNILIPTTITGKVIVVAIKCGSRTLTYKVNM